MSFEMLFSSFKIGTLRLRNRIIMASVGTNLSNRDGTVSDRAIAYYAERAKGGAGMIVTESSPVSLIARHRPESFCGYDDMYLPGLRRYTEALHQNGSAACQRSGR